MGNGLPDLSGLREHIFGRFGVDPNAPQPEKLLEDFTDVPIGMAVPGETYAEVSPVHPDYQPATEGALAGRFAAKQLVDVQEGANHAA